VAVRDEDPEEMEPTPPHSPGRSVEEVVLVDVNQVAPDSEQHSPVSHRSEDDGALMEPRPLEASPKEEEVVQVIPEAKESDTATEREEEGDKSSEKEGGEAKEEKAALDRTAEDDNETVVESVQELPPSKAPG